MIERHYKTDSSGFTLIEMLLVVTIIGVLVGLILPQISGRSEQARIAAASADVKANLQMALEMYELDNRGFPGNEQGLDALISKPTTPPLPVNWRGPYIKKKPVDPWGNPYEYRLPGIHNTGGYDLLSRGPDAVSGSEDDIVNWEK